MSNQERRFRVALVGAGPVSRHHARAVQRLGFADLVGVCDIDRARADTLAAELGCAAANGLDELVTSRPDVVHVLTPPAFHADLAVQALQLGCDVLVEKPMALSVRDCDRMLAAAQATGRTLAVNHTARLDPIVLRALEIVRSGRIGDVLGVDVIRSNEYPAYAGGPPPYYYSDAAYPLYDIGVHGLSLFESFLGDIASFDVQCRHTGRSGDLAFDEWHGVARCRDGMGRLYLTFNVQPFHNEVVVYGTRATIYLDCYLQICTLRRPRPGPRWIERSSDALSRSASTCSQVVANFVRASTGRLERSPAIHHAVRAFYTSLRNGEPPPVTAHEGRTLTSWLERAASAPRDEAARISQQRATPPVPAQVLVTGGSGFVGAALVDRLVRAGQSVRVLVRNAAAPTHPRAQVVVGNLGNPDDVERAVRGVEVVYHVGATMGGSTADFECGTVWGTRNVVAACQRHHVTRLVHVSSLSVLQHVHDRDDAIVDEGWPVEPHPEWRGDYTRTKLIAERIVLEAVRRDALPAVIVRPGMILGPRTVPAAPSGAFTVAGRWIVMGSGDHALPLVFIDDAVDAICLAATAGDPGAVFHVVDAATVTQREYIDRCRATGAKGPSVQFVPEWLLMTVATVAGHVGKLARRQLPTRYQFRSLRPLARFDLSAARAGLHWTPTVGVREGLNRTFPQSHQGLPVATAAAGERVRSASS